MPESVPASSSSGRSGCDGERPHARLANTSRTCPRNGAAFRRDRPVPDGQSRGADIEARGHASLPSRRSEVMMARLPRRQSSRRNCACAGWPEADGEPIGASHGTLQRQEALLGDRDQNAQEGNRTVERCEARGGFLEGPCSWSSWSALSSPWRHALSYAGFFGQPSLPTTLGNCSRERWRTDYRLVPACPRRRSNSPSSCRASPSRGRPWPETR